MVTCFFCDSVRYFNINFDVISVMTSTREVKLFHARDAFFTSCKSQHFIARIPPCGQFAKTIHHTLALCSQHKAGSPMLILPAGDA